MAESVFAQTYDVDAYCTASELSRIQAATPITYYIAPNGDDTGPGTSTQPWKSFTRAWGGKEFGRPAVRVYAGDTLILKDGTYTANQNNLGKSQILAPANTEGCVEQNTETIHYITIKAEHDGQAVIDGQNTSVPVSLSSAAGNNFLIIEGIVAMNAGGPDPNSNYSAYALDHSAYNIFRRVSGYNISDDVNKIGAAYKYNDHVFTVGDGSHHNLLEDCIAAGDGRKMILLFQSHHNHIRRCFVMHRQWFNTSTTSTYITNGNGEGIDLYRANDTLAENNISYGNIPTHAIVVRANVTTRTANRNRLLGNIAVYSGLNSYDGSLSVIDYYARDPFSRPGDMEKEPPTHRVGMHMLGPGQLDGNVFINNLMYGNASTGFILAPPGGSYGAEPTNTIFYNNTAYGNTRDPNDVDGDGDYINQKNSIYGEGGEQGTDMFLEDIRELNSIGTYSSRGNVMADNYIAKALDPINTTSPYSTIAGTGAKDHLLNKRYIDGQEVAQPLWPWSMEQRAKDEFARYFNLNGFSITAAVLPIIQNAPSDAASTPLCLGDITQDKTRDLTDVIRCIRHLVGLETLTGNELAAADANQDGAVDLSDVIRIIRDLLGLELLPACS